MKNDKSVFVNIGASSHSNYDRAKADYYSTDESAITLLDKHHLLDKDISYWESACGGGDCLKS